MDKKKSALLLIPQLLKKNGEIWQLLHIIKEKNALSYTAELIVGGAVKKHFPQLPEGFYVCINKFSEKSIEATRQELIAMTSKMTTAGSKNCSLSCSRKRLTW